MTIEESPITFGSFRLVRELGRGGMGVVHEAEEVSSGRRVALKVLSPDIEYSDETYRRFEREARLAASVSHPRCVFVLGVHQHDGLPAIAMELMSGETLADRVDAEQQVPIVTAVRWMLDVLDGLAAGHRVGVIHRDIKPSNCYLTEDGRVKVGDFGLARTLVKDLSLTQSGQFLGSPSFASPEQVKGDAMDERTDIYSVGATLHTLIAGQPPYEGSGLGEVLSRILTEDPPSLRSLRAEVPRGLERVIRRAMRRDPGRRHGDVAALTKALRPWAAEGVASPPSVRVRAALMDLGVLLSLWLGGFCLFFFLQIFLARMVAVDDPIFDAIWPMLVWQWGILAYYPIVEAWRGGSLGKRVRGLSVVDHRTGWPAPARTFVRGVVAFALVAGVYVLWWKVVGVITITVVPILPLIGLAFLFVTARRRNGHRGLHGFLSGTSVVADASRSSVPGALVGVLHQAPEPSSMVSAMVGRWSVEGLIGSTPYGQLLSATDNRLDRNVWIEVGSVPQGDRGPRSRSAGRLHLLEELREDGREQRVFEDPGGAAIVHYRERGRCLPWSLARDVLEQVVELLDHPDRPSCTEQLWIDKDVHVRVLDLPLAASVPPDRDEITILSEVTAVILAPGEQPPADLPFHAEELVSRLVGRADRYDSLDAVRRDLHDLTVRPTALSQRAQGFVRLLVLGISITAMVFLIAIIIGPLMGDFLTIIVLTYGVFATTLAVLLRGGLGLLIAGIGVRSATGARASRLRCAARSLLTWMPIWACLQGAAIADTSGFDPRFSGMLRAAAVLILVCIIVLSYRLTFVSPQDRIAGTRLVPR